MQEDLDYGLTVSTSNFENHIKILKSKYKICSMDEFIENLKKNSNKFMVTITFDDGYKDNLVHALPLLEKYKVPALIYVATKFLNKNVDMWWYELGEAIHNNSKLSFIYDKKNFNLNLENYKQKSIAYNNLTKIFMKLKIDQQTKLMEKITGTTKRKNYSIICLNSEQVKLLDNHPLITIGSHGHNHENLNILSDKEMKFDVTMSLEILENLLNHKVKHFCYPFGGKKEASDREFKIIENLNFHSAVTARTYPIKKYNIFSLPRIYIGKKACTRTLINHLSGFYNLVKKFY